jgi:hypothetical protein
MPHAINVSKVGGLDCGDHSWRFPVWVGEIDAEELEELLVAQGLSGRRGRCYEGIVGGSQRGRLSIHRKPEGILRKQYEELAANRSTAEYALAISRLFIFQRLILGYRFFTSPRQSLKGCQSCSSPFCWSYVP